MNKPRVKKLVWEKRKGDLYLADTPFGLYCVEKFAAIDGEEEGWHAYIESEGPPYDYDTAEEAKVGAQADYESRILSALEGGDDG